MAELKNIKIINNIFDIDVSEMSESAILTDIGFDSMAKIILISILEDDHDIVIDPDDLEHLLTIIDLDIYISEVLN